MAWRMNTSANICVSYIGEKMNVIFVSFCVLSLRILYQMNECTDYGLLQEHVTKTWPALPHTPLLETCVMELMEIIFTHSKHITSAEVRIVKPDILLNVKQIGLELTLTRDAFEQVS